MKETQTCIIVPREYRLRTEENLRWTLTGSHWFWGHALEDSHALTFHQWKEAKKRHRKRMDTGENKIGLTKIKWIESSKINRGREWKRVENSKSKVIFLRSFFVQVCTRRCNRSNLAFFFYLLGHMPPMSLKLWFLRVSVEPVDIPVASDVSFCLFLCFFFLFSRNFQ